MAMNNHSSDHAAFALAEYDRRREKLVLALADRTITPDRARHQQRCWLAIAILAGAEPADASAELEYQRRASPHDPRAARAFAADHCAPRPAWSAELTRAAVVALRAADAPGARPETLTRARHLRRLREHLGVTDPIPAPAQPAPAIERKAA
jgi:hypothetical protein